MVAACPHLWLQVQEKDVVLLIHEHGSMQLKELVAKFKPLMGGEKEDKAHFMAIVKRVAALTRTRTRTRTLTLTRTRTRTPIHNPSPSPSAPDMS